MQTIKQMVEGLPEEYRDCFVVGFAAIILASHVHSAEELKEVIDTEEYTTAFMVIKHLTGKVIDRSVITDITLFGHVVTVYPNKISMDYNVKAELTNLAYNATVEQLVEALQREGDLLIPMQNRDFSVFDTKQDASIRREAFFNIFSKCSRLSQVKIIKVLEEICKSK